jgi:hypothetical protein
MEQCYMTDEANDGQGSPMSIERAERELAVARQRVAEMEARLSAGRDRVTKLEHYIEVAREFGSGFERQRREAPGQAEGQRRPAPIRGVWARITSEAVTILRERGEPISAKGLVPLLASRGIRINTKNPDRALSQYLSREPGVIGDHARGNVGQGWFLKEWGDRFDVTREAAAGADASPQHAWHSEAAE